VTAAPQRTALGPLLDRYDGLLLDAYGVLVTQGGPLPGGAELIAELRRRGQPFWVVTNDASRLPETCERRFRGFGLDIAAADVITAGALLGPWFARHGLAGAGCLVLGTDDSRAYVDRAGGRVLAADADADYDVIAVCDDAGFPFLETSEIAMTVALRGVDRGRPPRLVLPNPDLIYPKGGGAWGFTSGAIALLLEAALARRCGPDAPAFERLGKPHAPIFEEAIRRAGSRKLLMIGDQLETDIAGARGVGLDAALLTTGVSRWEATAPVDAAAAPTYLLDALAP
jgi:ribonucleotide monophosphatase NagD (HAD superfamily)